MVYSKEFLQLLDKKTLYWADSSNGYAPEIVDKNVDNIYKRLGKAILFNGLYSNKYPKKMFSIVHSIMSEVKSVVKPDRWYCFYRDDRGDCYSNNLLFLTKEDDVFSFLRSTDIKRAIETGKPCLFDFWEIVEFLDINIEKSYKTAVLH